MTTWRATLLDQVESELRGRFGDAILIARQQDDTGALCLAATWREGGGAFVRLPADAPFNFIAVDHAVEHVTTRLWDYAPIVGSC